MAVGPERVCLPGDAGPGVALAASRRPGLCAFPSTNFSLRVRLPDPPPPTPRLPPVGSPGLKVGPVPALPPLHSPHTVSWGPATSHPTLCHSGWLSGKSCCSPQPCPMASVSALSPVHRAFALALPWAPPALAGPALVCAALPRGPSWAPSQPLPYSYCALWTHHCLNLCSVSVGHLPNLSHWKCKRHVCVDGVFVSQAHPLKPTPQCGGIRTWGLRE